MKKEKVKYIHFILDCSCSGVVFLKNKPQAMTNNLGSRCTIHTIETLRALLEKCAQEYQRECRAREVSGFLLLTEKALIEMICASCIYDE